MTEYLIIVNAKQSIKTEKFWAHHHEEVEEVLESKTIFIPDFDMDDWPIFENFSTIIMVGDDSFFSRILNTIYQQSKFSDKTQLAFIPDSPRDSSIGKSLKLPSDLGELLHLIKCKHSIFINLIRCSYIDRSGFPATYLAANDILIGTSTGTVFPLATTVFKWVLNAFSPHKKNNTVTISYHNKELYNGSYIIAILLLGNYITRGPKIRSKRKVYKRKFDIYQFKCQSILKLTSSLSKMYFGKDKEAVLNHWELDDAEFKSLGQRRNIIADGVHIGRLPANFTLLPKAVKVVSAFNMIKVKSRWKSIVPSAVNASETLTRMHKAKKERQQEK